MRDRITATLSAPKFWTDRAVPVESLIRMFGSRAEKLHDRPRYLGGRLMQQGSPLCMATRRLDEAKRKEAY